jgi:hypothetical protein
MTSITQPISLLREVTSQVSLLVHMVITTHWAQSDINVDEKDSNANIIQITCIHSLYDDVILEEAKSLHTHLEEDLVGIVLVADVLGPSPARLRLCAK